MADGTWSAAEAKAKFSEVIEKARTEGPQHVTRHGKAAPFKRNDRMLEILPIGVIVCPGSGISANLADKARMLGIPVWRLGNSGA